MRLAVIGTGYVGLVSGTCFAEFGLHVTCVDKDPLKINSLKAGEMPIYEPGLPDLVQKNVAAGRLCFTESLTDALADADVVFIAVGTPSRRGDGHADLSYVFAAVTEIAALFKQNKGRHRILATKSTVPVGTGARIQEMLADLCPECPVDVVSNPEFLREGSAIDDFMRPDRVVIGASSDRAFAVMRELYRPLYLLETPLVNTSLETAELIKYAANAFLATKIAFINEVADLCEKCGADVSAVSKGMGLDKRIGSKFLHAGPGYGGSCFPKDTLAFIQTAKSHDVSVSLVDAVSTSNDKRKIAMAKKIIDHCGGSVAGKTLAILGVTFKPGTDDMRDSPSLSIIPALQTAGASVRVYDPQGKKEGTALLPGVTWCDSPYDALKNSDSAAILTEWNEFRALDLDRVKTLMKTPLIIDLRNIYELDEMRRRGIHYVSIGRPVVVGA